MSKSPESYALTRWNATSWGNAVEGPLTCRGRTRCRYTHCDPLDGRDGPIGHRCRYEAAYAEVHEKSFREDYGWCAQANCINDFDALAKRVGISALKRLRADLRENAASLLLEGPVPHEEAFREFALAHRYYIAALNELKKIHRVVRAAAEEIAARREFSRRFARGLEPLPDGTYIWQHHV